MWPGNSSYHFISYISTDFDIFAVLLSSSLMGHVRLFNFSKSSKKSNFLMKFPLFRQRKDLHRSFLMLRKRVFASERTTRRKRLKQSSGVRPRQIRRWSCRQWQWAALVRHNCTSWRNTTMNSRKRSISCILFIMYFYRFYHLHSFTFLRASFHEIDPLYLKRPFCPLLLLHFWLGSVICKHHTRN